MITRKIRHIIAFTFSLLILSACEEAITLDLEFESQLVINSFFDSNSSWEVEVSTNGNKFDDTENIEFVTDARVIIYDQNNVELYELYHDENGMYISPEGYKPSPTRGYFIKVEVGPEVLTAYSYVPEESTLKINKLSVVEEEMSKGVEVDFQIEDKSNIEAYYIWEIVMVEEDNNSEINNSEKLSDALLLNLKRSEINSEVSKREIIGAGVFGNGTYSTVYNTIEGRRNGFNQVEGADNSINNNLGVIDLDGLEEFDDYIESLDPEDEDEDSEGQEDGEEGGEVIAPSYELRVVSISKELYEFYNSFEASIVTGGSKKHTYTNVVNGQGIFAGFNESTIQF
jgi:hypothetical protein